MKARLLSTALAVMFLSSSAHSMVQQQDVLGDWIPPDMDAIIRFEPCGDTGLKEICASLVRHAYGGLSETDALNSDPELQSRNLIGIDIVSALKSQSEKFWRGGTLYDPRTGKKYHAKLKIINKDKIKLSGCIGPGLCKGYIWRRATDETPLVQGTVVTQISQKPSDQKP